VEEVGDHDVEVDQAVGPGFLLLLGVGSGTGIGSGDVDDRKVKVRDCATGGSDEGL